MLISEYLNQSVTLKSKASVNAYNEATYASSTINARFEYKRRMIRNSDGEELMSLAQIFTTTQVKPDDVIVYESRDWQVVTVEDCVDLEGNVHHYEVSLWELR